MTITGPAVHKGLSLFFIHGPSRDGIVPLTLQEALAKGTVAVEETQDVNELTIENKGTEEVFIQAGDVVKGGWQDRVLSVSMLLAPMSGKVPIAAFCVESGRWSQRAAEDAAGFSESSVQYSTRKARLAMMEYASAASESEMMYRKSVSQRAVWDSVESTQTGLSRRLKKSVRSAASPSSLQLSMEDGDVKALQDAYLAELEKAGRVAGDITGVVFAINGKVHSAEAYPWAGLFQKMWAKNLTARVAEVVAGEQEVEAHPETPAAAAFLADAETGAVTLHPLPGGAELRQKRGKTAVVQEAAAGSGDWVHRTYLPA